jgi:hypothetical protein
MSKQFTSLVATLALVAVAAAAPQAQARLPEHPAKAAAFYPIPPAHTPAVAVHSSAVAAANYLATLSPSALAATGGLELSAGAPGPGTFTFVLTARLHGRVVVIGRGSKAAGHAGALTIKLTFTKAGKSALAGATGKFVVTVAATFKPKHGKAKTARSTATLH